MKQLQEEPEGDGEVRAANVLEMFVSRGTSFSKCGNVGRAVTPADVT